MSNKNAETEKTLFEDGVNYTVKSPDRKYILKLENGKILYLNKEQYSFVKSDLYQERRESYLNNRCNVLAVRGGCKKCTDDCNLCCWFMTDKTNGGQIRLDVLFDENEFELPDTSASVLEDMIYEEKINYISKFINELEDEIDIQLIKLLLKGKTEREIANTLNLTKSTVHDRKNKIYQFLKKKIEKLII